MSWQQKLNSLIRKLDIVGRKPAFRINDQNRFTTTIGGILSIFVLVLMVLSFLNFGQEIYFRHNPTVVNSIEEVTTSDQSFNINTDNDDGSTFAFIVSLQDTQTGKYITDNLSNYDIIVYTTDYTLSTNFNSSSENIQAFSNVLTQCKEEYLPLKFREVSLFDFIRPRINNYLCLNSNMKISLNDYYDQANSVYHYKQIAFELVVKNISNFQNNIKIDVTYSNIVLDNRNVDTASYMIFKTYTSYIALGRQKVVTLSLKRLGINVDQGYVLEDYHLTNAVQFEEINETYRSVPIGASASANLFNFQIQLSHYKYTVYKKYKKAQQILAEVGGIMKAFLLIAFLLNYFHNNVRYYEKMIANIFDETDLHKNFQYYEEKNKHLYSKYRNSIALRRTKEIENFRRDFLNTSLVNNYMTDLNDVNRHSSLNKGVTRDNKTRHTINGNIPSNTTNVGLLSSAVDTTTNNHIVESEKSEDSMAENMINKDVIQNTIQNANIKNKSNGNEENEININSNTFAYQRETTPVLQSSMTKKSEAFKLNKSFKVNFDKMKNDRFFLSCAESHKIKYLCCCLSPSLQRKRQILNAGRFLINARLDVITVLKKVLDFDRFKNLVLKDHQLVLLNSLSRFLLDPETVNLVDFKNITFDKLIDALVTSNQSNSVIDHNLREFVKTKFQLDRRFDE